MTNRSASTPIEEQGTYSEAVELCKRRSGEMQNRIITQFEASVRDMEAEAANDMKSITWLQNLLPDYDRSPILLETL